MSRHVVRDLKAGGVWIDAATGKPAEAGFTLGHLKTGDTYDPGDGRVLTIVEVIRDANTGATNIVAHGPARPLNAPTAP